MKQKKTNLTLHPYLLYTTLILFVGVFGYNLWTKGLFVDSIFYGALAQNLAQGYGDCWYMSPTQNYYFNPFQGHPPLGIWLLSGFMYLFDSQFWVERFFSLFHLIFLLFGIYKIWSVCSPPSIHKSAVWWVFLLWLVMPINIWGYGQYTLENTMSIFIVWSIYFFVQAMQQRHVSLSILWASLLTIAATFVKGPVGLFPLAFPFIHWLVFRQHKWYQILLWTILPTISIILFYAILYFSNEAAARYLTFYYEKQLVGSLQGSNNVVNSRFYIIKVLLVEGIVCWIILASTLAIKQTALGNSKKWGLCFLLLALAGSLPIALSPKQMNFYIIPSLPFLALAAGLISIPLIDKKLATFSKPPAYFVYFLHFILILVMSISLTRYGKYARDEALIAEILILRETIPAKTKIIIQSAVPNYIAECYAVRYADLYLNNHRWHLTAEEEELDRTPFLLVQKNYRSTLFPYYKKNDSVSQRLTTWDLWEAK